MAVLFLVSVTSLLEQSAANSGDRICRVIQMAEV
jgi:hypothetical protein